MNKKVFELNKIGWQALITFLQSLKDKTKYYIEVKRMKKKIRFNKGA